MYFPCTRDVIQNYLNQNSSKVRDFVQAIGPHLSICDYLVGVSSLLLLTFSHWKKPYGFLIQECSRRGGDFADALLSFFFRSMRETTNKTHLASI